MVNNVTLSCSFTGDLIHTNVYWTRRYQKLTNNTTIVNNNTAILNLFIDAIDAKTRNPPLGSYQCVVMNKAGYVSRTARVLPEGNNF